jgi:HEAT repeat protein
MIVFDDDNVVVKTLAFEQPTAWLANQLARSSDLWNRWWAIGQLAGRPGDSLAAVALAGAARGADYPLTRAEAATALARFPAGVATPALQAAAGDTSAQVREAALSALGAVGGAGSLGLVRRAWAGDSSYRVRAAALTALVKLGAEEWRSAVLEGLETPSYRDVIQNAAIVAAVQRSDSGLVAGLERVAGDQQLPSIALAALAGRGDGAARAALDRLVADRRPWVRAWALDAAGSERIDRPSGGR